MKLDERVVLAKEKTSKLVDAIRGLLQVHENNAFIVCSSKLSDQIPKSYAAHSFNVLQKSLIEYEIVRVCALWYNAKSEKEAPDRDSFPAISWLIQEQSVRDILANEAKSYFAAKPTRVLNNKDDIDQAVINKAIAEHRNQFAAEQAEQVEKQLIEAQERIEAVQDNSEYKHLLNFRNKHIAHLLSRTYAEKEEPMAPPKYGFESNLLSDSIKIIELLHMGINGADFDWEDAQLQAKRNATALWEGCKIEVLE